MTNLECALSGCGGEAVTIWMGFTLCVGCYENSDEIPAGIEGTRLLAVLSHVKELGESAEKDGWLSGAVREAIAASA